jgi:predicted aminopeptidase
MLNRNRLVVVACASLVVLLMQLQGCYYMQAVHGHMEVMQSRRPLDEILADASAPADLKERLKLVQEARQFAVDELALPDNDSYTSYADLERDYVVWNVFAAPEFSLDPKQWCFPVAGCVAYRGYFSRDSADEQAEHLGEDGYDVAVGGVAAYSTLGKFADPVLNTMMRWNDVHLVATLFHELAHQRLYVKGDTQFNESFASTVADLGIRRWLADRGGEAALDAYYSSRRLQQEMLGIIEARKHDLYVLYGSSLPAPEMRARKEAIFAQLGQELSALLDRKAPTPAPGFVAPGNNAALVSYGLYEGRAAAFRSLYEECGGSLECFYRRSRELADLPEDERSARLALLGEGP